MPLHASSMPTIPVATSITLPCGMAGMPSQPSSSAAALVSTRVNPWMIGCSISDGQGMATKKKQTGKTKSEMLKC